MPSARLLTSLLALGLLAPVPAAHPESFARLRDGIDACYRQDYVAARRLAAGVRDRDPTDPAGAYWQAALVQMELYDSGDTALVDSFYRLSDVAAAVCRERIETAPDDAGAHFYLGMTRLNLANCQSWQRQRSTALKTMLGVQPEMRAALRLAPDIVDPYFGLGAVEYFRSLGNRYVLGLGLFGSKAKAYSWVEKVVADSGLCQPVAAFYLAWMRGQDGHYDEALADCRELLERYPGSRTVLRTMRDVCLAAGRYEEAVAAGRTLDSSIRADFPDNKYGLAENWTVTAKAWDGLAEADSVRHYAGLVTGWEQYRDEVPWLPAYLADARALLAKYRD